MATSNAHQPASVPFQARRLLAPFQTCRLALTMSVHSSGKADFRVCASSSPEMNLDVDLLSDRAARSIGKRIALANAATLAARGD